MCSRKAECPGDGNRLGPVGGRIVAEVIVGLVRADPASYAIDAIDQGEQRVMIDPYDSDDEEADDVGSKAGPGVSDLSAETIAARSYMQVQH
jgi:hypothetical protein